MATRNNHALQLTIFTTLGGLMITALGLLWPRVAPLPNANAALELSSRFNLSRFAPDSPQVLVAVAAPLPPAPSTAPTLESLNPLPTPVSPTIAPQPLPQSPTSPASVHLTPGRSAISVTPVTPITSVQAVQWVQLESTPPTHTGLAALASAATSAPSIGPTAFDRPSSPNPDLTLAPALTLANVAHLPSTQDEAYLAQGGSFIPDPETWAEHYQDWIWGIGGVIFALVVWLGLYISRLQEQLRQLRRQMSDRQDAFVQLHHQLQEATQEAETHQSLVAQLQEQLDNTQTNYHDSQDQCKTLTQQIEALQTRLQERRNEVAYVHLLEEENQALNQTHQELLELQAKLERQQEKVMVLAAERDSLSQQLSQVSHKLQYCGMQQITHEDLPPLDTELQHTLRIDCAKDLGKLPMKEFRQLMQRIVELQTTPRPHDSRPLNKYGLRDVFSVDAGEYRICYRIQEEPEHHLAQIQVLMVDKRNDGTIYNRLRRALG
ncbi:MAG: hypothetical protein ACO34J_03940 [Prochlorothrix sp.]